MGIAVLGPLQVDGQGTGLSPRDRVVLSALVVRAGGPISTEALADALWGEELPASWAKVLQGCVVRLRKRLGSAAIESAANGYRLALTDDELDVRVFERLLERSRDALAGGDAGRASYLAQESLDLWRGPALPDLEEWSPAQVETARLHGLRMDAEEVLVEAGIDAGRAREVVDRARALTAQAPYRERRWALLARALHQSGREPEALGALRRARTMLVEEFGLDPGPELAELEAMLLRQDPALLSSAPSPEASPTCPYRGLLPYGAADADTFFGREDDIAACLRRLRDTRVLTVVGPSGVGKSSLVRAGVMASLERSGTSVLFTTPGPHPLDSLSGLKPRGRQTLVVDQTEEAVTLCADHGERRRYFEALALHVGAGGALVLALRADHLGDLAPYPEIARVVEDGLYLLGPLGEAGLRSAIEGPAHRAGLRLEPGLVDLLVRDVEGEPAALPLLSHVLRETWERREGPTLTVAGYRATGGIRQAVAQSAESLYDGMGVADRTHLRALMLRLVMATEDGDPVRARLPRAKIAADVDRSGLVEQLVAARLVAVDGDTVQIAHEALVRVWPRLRGWLDDDVDGQRLLRHVAGAADAWDALGRPDSELYRGMRLSRTLEWCDRTAPDLDATETAFLDASTAHARAEQRAAATRQARERRSRRRLRSAVAGVALFVVVALVAGIFAIRNAHQAGQDRRDRDAAALLAEARRAGAAAPTQDDPTTALLLGVATLQVDSSPEQWENLAATLTRVGPLRRVQETADESYALAASGDGALVAVSLVHAGVQLFDATTMEQLPFDDDGSTSVIDITPDGRLMAVAVNQWTGGPEPRIVPQPVRFYDLPSGRLSSSQPGGWPEGAFAEGTLSFSRDGRRMVVDVNRYVDGENLSAYVMVWDVAHPARPIFRANLPDGPRAALSADGRRVYTALTDQVLREYDVDSGRLLRQVRLASISPTIDGSGDLELSPDGTTLAQGSGNRIILVDTASLRPRAVLTGHTGPVGLMRFSHDGALLLSGSDTRDAILWDVATSARLRTLSAHRDQVWGVGFAPDDRSAYTATDYQLLTWDVTGRGGFLSEGTLRQQAGRLGDSIAAPDGRTLLRFENEHMWFADSRTGPTSVKSPTHGRVEHAAWSPDAHWLVTTEPGSLSLWDARTGRKVATRPYSSGAAPLVAFSHDGDRIHVDDRLGRLETVDRASLQPLAPPIDFESQVVSLLPDPVDQTVLATLDNGTLARFDPAAGTVRYSDPGQLPIGDGQVAALSPDGSLIATVHPDRTLQLLDAHTFEWLGEPSQRHWAYNGSEWGFNLAFSPDGSQFASMEPDRIGLWDGHTGAYLASVPLQPLLARPGEASGLLAQGSSIAYLPDGSGLLLASADGRAWVVDTRLPSWTERACAIAGRNLTQAEWAQFFPSRSYHATCPQWPAGA